MRVAIGPRFDGWPQPGSQLPEDTGEVLVARDAQMESDWDEWGYVPDVHGEGPIAIYYQPFARPTAEVMALQDPYDRGDEFIFEPYKILLAAPGLWLLTLVSPEESPVFREALLGELMQAGSTSSP
jgi:hypothetical protein